MSHLDRDLQRQTVSLLARTPGGLRQPSTTETLNQVLRWGDLGEYIAHSLDGGVMCLHRAEFAHWLRGTRILRNDNLKAIH